MEVPDAISSSAKAKESSNLCDRSEDERIVREGLCDEGGVPLEGDDDWGFGRIRSGGDVSNGVGDQSLKDVVKE